MTAKSHVLTLDEQELVGLRLSLYQSQATAAVLAAPIDAHAKILLVALMSRFDATRVATISLPELSKLCGMSTRTAQRWIAALRKVGAIVVVRGRGGRGASRYELRLPGTARSVPG